MTNDFISNQFDKSRREVLLNVCSLFDNPNYLREIAGENALLDCTLYLLALNNDELKTKLSNVLNIKDLEIDIQHIVKNRELRKLLEEKFGG